jgi:hypothetical protein
MIKNLAILILLIAASRFIGLPANFSPLLALAIFMPRLTDDLRIQHLLPVAIVGFTNLFLEPVNGFIFIALLLVFVIAPLLSRSTKNLFYGGLAAVLIWHVVVNGAVWMISGGSLIETFIAAIPFDLKLAISTGLYVALFYCAENFWMNYTESNKKFLDMLIY